MAYAIAAMLLVSLAGVGMMAATNQHQMQIMHYGLMARLRVATENALETVRGRFALVQGAQEDWNSLLPNSGWNTIQTVNVNGVNVVVAGQSVGTTAVPRCRLRAVGTLAGRSWASQYEFKQTALSEFSMFCGGTNTQSIPSHTHMNGGYYSKPTINLNNESDIHFYKPVATSGSVSSPENATFYEGYTTGTAVYSVQPMTTPFANAKADASATGTLHYSNTSKIELRGTVYRRYYERKTGPGSNNSNYSYVNIGNGAGWSADIAIPANGVIYIESDTCPMGVDADSAAWTNAHDNIPNNGAVEVWGWLENRRVSVFAEDKIKIVNNITYKSLMDNPDLRRRGEKQSPAAKAIPEMLSCITPGAVEIDFSSFAPLNSAYNVTNDSAYTAYNGVVYNDVGHQTNQYAIDGVFISVSDDIDRVGSNVAGTGKEIWIYGGLIAGGGTINNLYDCAYRNNIDWDWRLQDTDPPFVIKTFGAAPSAIQGTFRSYNPSP